MSAVLTKIINGELPGRFVYRNDKIIAFLTIESIASGHTLVAPIEEVDKWTDASPELWVHLDEVAQKTGQAVVSALDVSRAGYLIAGFEVPHTHIHIFPTHDMSGYNLQSMDHSPSAESMDEVAAKLREALRTDEDRKLVR